MSSTRWSVSLKACFDHGCQLSALAKQKWSCWRIFDVGWFFVCCWCPVLMLSANHFFFEKESKQRNKHNRDSSSFDRSIIVKTFIVVYRCWLIAFKLCKLQVDVSSLSENFLFFLKDRLIQCFINFESTGRYVTGLKTPLTIPRRKSSAFR